MFAMFEMVITMALELLLIISVWQKVVAAGAEGAYCAEALPYLMLYLHIV